MVEVSTQALGNTLFLDVCCLCYLVWFDPREYEAAPPPPPEKDLSPEARLALAQMQMELEKDREVLADLKELSSPIGLATGGTWTGPEENWKWVPGFFGMPVEWKHDYLQRIPWITWVLGLLFFLVFLLNRSHLDTSAQHWGFIPAQAWRGYGITFLTSFFLHSGWFHLLTNVYFLLIFGDNVEDLLGPRLFLVFIFLTAVAGNLLVLLFQSHSVIPRIGASGGISGILLFYALTFPKARLGIFFWIYYHPRWFRFPAFLFVFVWVGCQFIGGMFELAGARRISFLSHLGGILAALAFWLFWKRNNIKARDTLQEIEP